MGLSTYSTAATIATCRWTTNTTISGNQKWTVRALIYLSPKPAEGTPEVGVVSM